VPVPVAEGREPLALLRDAVAALGGERCEGLPPAALRMELEGLRRQIDLLEGEFVRRVGCMDRLREFFPDEVPGSLIGWLRSSCRLSGGAAVERVEVSRQLARLPLTGEALARGEIGYEHARVIARTAAELGSAVVSAAEPTLLLSAQQVDPSRLKEVAQDVCHLLDPEGASDAARRLFERRRVRYHRTADGAFALEGLLAPEGGAMLSAALDALMTPLPGDRRTTLQRRADALVELARRQLQGGSLPQVAGQRPHLTLTVAASALRGGSGSDAVGPDTIGIGAGHPGSGGSGAAGEAVARLGWAGAVPLTTAQRIACDAAVATVTVDAKGNPLDVGRTTRTIPAAIRRALVLRDRGCRFPGCNRPPEWTDGHHIRPWAEGGETRLDNLVLLCQACHTDVHERRLLLSWDAHGALVAEPP
jgi:hypothetical protein